MRLATIAVLSAVVCGSMLAQHLFAQQAAQPEPLKVGDTAPDFTLQSTTGQKVSLSEFKGKKAVVLAFFPAAFTGG